MRHARGAVAGAVLAAGGGAAGQTFEYTGLPNASWYVATNWSPNGVPGVSPVGVAVMVQQAPVSLDPGTPAVILSLAAPAGMTVNNGLAITTNGSITNGTFKGTDTLSGFQCFGTLTLTGTTTWLGGIVSCGNVIHSGTMTIGGVGGTGPNPQFAGTFHNQGAVSGALLFRTNALVENGGDWALGQMGMAAGHTGGMFRNLDECTRSAGEVTISTSFDNQANLLITGGGIVNLNGFASTIDGAVFLGSNSRLRVFQSGAAGAPATRLGFNATGQGDLLLDSGNHTVHAAASAQMAAASPFGLWINNGAGTLRLEANLTNSGKATFATGRIQSEGGALINTEAGTLIWGTPSSTAAGLTGVVENRGVTIMRGSPRLDTATVVNQPGALLDVTSGAFSQAALTLNVVDNFGTVRKGTLNSGSTIFGAPLVTAGGRVECERSILSLNAGSDFLGNSVIKVGPQTDARLILDGPFHAVSGGEVRLQGSPGAVEIGTSGVVTVSGGRVINELASPSEMRVFGKLNCQVGQGFINEGRLRIQDGTINGGNSSLAGFESHGLLELNGGWILGKVLNLGNMVLLFNTEIGQSSTDGQLSNSGTFELRNNMTLTLATPGSVLDNNFDGLILKDTPAGNNIFGPGLFDNAGTVRVLQGAIILNGPVAQLSNGQLTGGTWTVAPGANLYFPGGVITNITGQAVVQGNGASVPAIQSLDKIDDAELFVDGLLNLGTTGLGLINGAVLRIGETGAVSAGGAVINGEVEDPLSEIEMVLVVPLMPGPGPSLTTPSLQNHATLVPGGHGEPGPFNLSGNLQMFAAGRVIVDLAGLTPLDEHDRMVVTGNAALGGKLEVRLIDGFTPALGHQFVVLTATGTVTGTFSSIVQPPNMPAGLKLAAQYAPGSVTLVVQDSCYPDCNADGALTVADFGCFQTKFVLGDPYTDCNGDGARTVADFGCFQTRFVVGCP